MQVDINLTDAHFSDDPANWAPDRNAERCLEYVEAARLGTLPNVQALFERAQEVRGGNRGNRTASRQASHRFKKEGSAAG